MKLNLKNTITPFENGAYITDEGLFDNNNNHLSDVEGLDAFFNKHKKQSYPVVYIDNNTVNVITYVETRGKSAYSFHDSIVSIPELIESVDVAVGIQDHGVAYGLFEFNQSAIKAKKKPIMGIEFYIKNNLNEHQHDYDHLVVIAKNLDGYKTLSRLATLSASRVSTEDYQAKNSPSRPYLYYEDFENVQVDNLIVLHGYRYSSLNRAIEARDTERLYSEANRLIDLFGKEDFYIEIQYHEDVDIETNHDLYDLAEKYDLKTVYTNDFHMIHKNQSDVLEVYQGMGDKSGALVYEGTWHLTGDHWHVHTTSEVEGMGMSPELTDNSIEIYNKVEVYDLYISENFTPNYKIPEGFKDNLDYMKYIAWNGLRDKVGDAIDSEEYQERLKMEIEVIEQMGYIEYFIIVADFINYAKRNFSIYDNETVERWKKYIKENGHSMDPIAVGPGRGSACGSLLAYGMGITEVNPVEYGLLFERFLNPERVSMPDIDTDFPEDMREEVLAYTRNYYNTSSKPTKAHVAGIATFGTYKLKKAIKSVVSALYQNVSYGEELTDLITDDNISWDDFIQSPEVEDRLATDSQFQLVAKIIPHIEGLPSNLSQHASGYVITPNPLQEYVPATFAYSEKSKGMVMLTAYTDVESVGLLKMDFLGLKEMSIINNTIQNVNEDKNLTLTTQEIIDKALVDLQVFRFIEDGNTGDLFQLSSSGMTSVITRSLADVYTRNAADKANKGEFFSRIIAGIAMYRPGPMQFIDQYIENALHPERIEYTVPEMKEVLEDSYGLLIYQEGIMALLRIIAGFTLGGADVARRAIGKKDAALLASQKEIFFNGDGDKIPGGLELGHSSDELEEMWDNIEQFAEYGFNKSHAAGYAHITLMTAYLSHYYPSYFAVSNLNYANNTDKTIFLNMYKARDIKVIEPSVNQTNPNFATDGENIIFGLNGIRMLKNKSVYISSERNRGGEFTSIYNFLQRMARNQPDSKLDSRSYEALILSGAFDVFGYSRKSMMDSLDKISDVNRMLNRTMKETEYLPDKLIFDKTNDDYFYKFLNLNSIEFLDKEIYDQEFHFTGLYISGHPTENYHDVANDLPNYYDMKEVEPMLRDISSLVIITDIKKIITKNNDMMAFISIEDETGAREAVVFPDAYTGYGRYLKEKNVVIISGYTQEDGTFVVSSLEPADEHIPYRAVDHIQIKFSDLSVKKERDIQNLRSTLVDILQRSRGQQRNGNYVWKLGYTTKDSDVGVYYKIKGNRPGTVEDLIISSDLETINYVKSLVGEDNFTIVYNIK